MFDQLAALQNPEPTLPTMQFSHSLSDINGGKLSDYMQLPLEPQKALRYFFT